MSDDPKRILIIDDSAAYRELLCARLAAEVPAWTLTQSDHVADGLVALTRGSFDAALVDYQMPDGTGVDLIRSATARGVQTPMILLTGLVDPALDRQAFVAGASDFLEKERAQPQRLAAVIRRAIWRRDAARALEAQRTVLERAEARLRVLEASPQGYVVVSELGALRYANPAGRRLMELGREEDLGAPRRLADGFRVTVEGPDGAPLVIEQLERGITWQGAPAVLVSLRECAVDLLGMDRSTQTSAVEAIQAAATVLGPRHTATGHLAAALQMLS